jgi:hypothetical protein
MGWKTINGRRYSYKSEREGGRVDGTRVTDAGISELKRALPRLTIYH